MKGFTKCFVRVMNGEPEQYDDGATQYRTFHCSKAERTFAYRRRKKPLTGSMTYQEAMVFFNEECFGCKRFRQKVLNAKEQAHEETVKE